MFVITYVFICIVTNLQLRLKSTCLSRLFYNCMFFCVQCHWSNINIFFMAWIITYGISMSHDLSNYMWHQYVYHDVSNYVWHHYQFVYHVMSIIAFFFCLFCQNNMSLFWSANLWHLKYWYLCILALLHLCFHSFYVIYITCCFVFPLCFCVLDISMSMSYLLCMGSLIYWIGNGCVFSTSHLREW